MDISSFFHSEISDPPPPTPGVRCWGAGRDAGEIYRGISAEQMCGPALQQQLISIDLFWRQLWVCGQEGRGLSWGGWSQEGGAAWQRHAGPLGLGLALRVRPLDSWFMLCQR